MAVAASKPWPSVCPKFRISRRPPSCSSCITTSALIRMQRAITHASAAESRRKKREHAFFEESEELGIGDDAIFDHFVEPRAVFAVWKRGERVGIDDDEFGRIERSDKILPFRQVHASFAADGTINLRDKRRGNVDEPDATQIGRQRRNRRHRPPPRLPQRQSRRGDRRPARRGRGRSSRWSGSPWRIRCRQKESW